MKIYAGTFAILDVKAEELLMANDNPILFSCCLEAKEIVDLLCSPKKLPSPNRRYKVIEVSIVDANELIHRLAISEEVDEAEETFESIDDPFCS